ncbi:MAG TPA: hypothetical protein VGJ13_05430 [Pseudonocardiaceae bacterium]
MKPSLVLLTLGVVLTLVTGCGIVTIERGDMRTLTEQEAWSRVSVAKVYWIRDLPHERNNEIVNALYSYWLSHDYRVLSDQRDIQTLFVENNTDAFRMSLQSSVQGDLSISATSPCVWPDGTPPPTLRAADPQTARPRHHRIFVE